MASNSYDVGVVTAEQSRLIEEAHLELVRAQVAKGNDPATPDDRKAGSDYNQHGAVLEASGSDWDAYDAKVRVILGLPPLAA